MRPGDGRPEQVGGAHELELFPDAMAVGLDGFDPDMELLGDLAGVESATGQLKDLQLAIRQGFDG